MIDVQPIIKAIEAYVRRWIQEMGGTPGSGGYAPRPHDLSSDNHTGSISDAQGPQFLKTDGSRMLTGDQTVAAGVTFDGVDVSEHKLATDALTSAYNAHKAAAAAAGHDGGVGDHNHQTAGAQGGPLDHGAALTGLGDDDHTQYLLVNGARAMSGHLLPSLTDTYDLGSSTRLWRKGWLSELDTIIFAKNTITLLGGWLVVGPNEGSLAADVLAADTSIDFGMTMTVGDFVLFRGILQVEYMQVGALVSGTRYNVTRNLDGSGANNWPMGTPYAVNGQNGAGRIELNAYATPRMSILRQGATYNAQTELIRIGDLNAWGDYVSEVYGAAFGDYAGAGANVTIDPTNGVRLRRGNVDVIKLTATDATFKSLIKMPDTTSALAIGATPPTSSSAGTGIWIDRTGLYSLAGGLQQARIDAVTGEIVAGYNAENSVADIVKMSRNGLIIKAHEPVLFSETGVSSMHALKFSDGLSEFGSYIAAGKSSANNMRIMDIATRNPSGGSAQISIYAGTKYPTNEYAWVNVFHGAANYFNSYVSIGPRLEVNSDISIGSSVSNPSYDTRFVRLFNRNASLYALSPANIPANLSAGSSAAYLMPLTFSTLRGLWMMNDAIIGGNRVAPDLGPAQEHLSRIAVGWAGIKGAPGSLNMLSFDGSTSYLYRAIDTTIGVSSGFLFGTWIYLDAVNRNHGVVRMGSTTVSWQVLYFYGSDINRYFELSYYESGGTQRIIGTIQHNTTGWVYVEAYIAYTASGNNYFQLKVNDTRTTLINQAWDAPRAPVGNLELGRAGAAGTYWLQGRMATAYLAHLLVHGNEYYAATRGNFEY